MAETRTLKCDCGCKAKLVLADTGENVGIKDTWIRTKQATNPGKYPVKLSRELHFSSPECIVRWAGKAAKEIPILKKSAQEAGKRRGTFINEKLGLMI